MKLYYLVYISYASSSLTDDSMVDLLHRARTKNRINELTGVLLMYNKRFIQVLEGSEERVKSLFEQIKKDSRHKGATVVAEGPLEKRNFKKWAMAYEKMDEDILNSSEDTVNSESLVLKSLVNSDAHLDHPSMILLKMFQKKNMSEIVRVADGIA